MKFSETHNWIEVVGEIATIGISAYAQNELGDIVYVELPSIGQKFAKDEEAVVIESTKAAIDIYTPLSGEIVAVNQTLLEHPEKIQHSPSKEGWLFKIKILNSKELKSLMDEEDYKKFLQK